MKIRLIEYLAGDNVSRWWLSLTSDSSEPVDAFYLPMNQSKLFQAPFKCRRDLIRQLKQIFALRKIEKNVYKVIHQMT